MTSVDERTLTLDDFIQLQALLSYEQEVRNKHIEQCAGNHSDGILEEHDPVHAHRHTQFRRALDPQAAVQSKLEQARLAEALLRLKWLKEQYRRERAMEIQLYLEYYRRQALIRVALQEEEERYYRQCIAAALEQRRIHACLQQFLDIKRQNELQLQFEKQQLSEGEDQQFSEEEHAGYDEYHSKQLQALLLHLFNVENQEEGDIACRKYAESEEQQAMSMAEVWKCLSDQKAKEETPRFAFLSSDQDALLGSTTSTPSNEEEDDISNDEQTTPAIEPQEEENKDAESNFPPIQDHVVSLQDLIRQLASQPVLVDNMRYSDEPKPSGIWANQTQQPASKQSPPPPPLNLKDSPVMQQQEESEKEEEPKPFLPQHIFTDAEPTPKLEHMPDTPVKDEVEEKKSFLPQHIFTEAEPTPKLEHSPNTPLTAHCEEGEDQDIQHFVDAIAAEQKNEIVPPDPRKVKAYEELDAISKQLIDEQSDLVKRWKHVLKRGKKESLSFHKQKEGTLLLTASTKFNREFLGSEDELTRLMLRLDAVDSLGDDDIRQERKNLVKKCESMLEKLDTFKQVQWERAMKQQQQQK